MVKEANAFTVVKLRALCSEKNLPTTGNKNELIARFFDADPDGDWRGWEPVDRERPNDDQQRQDLREVQLELAERERDLLRREVEIQRRELEFLRAQNVRNNGERTPEETRSPSVNIRTLAELMGEFQGPEDTFSRWERQLRLIQTTYQLDDNQVRLLVGLRLKGPAAAWFRSKPEHLELSSEDLLTSMREIYHHEANRLDLKREFEARRWKCSESFAEYFNDRRHP